MKDQIASIWSLMVSAQSHSDREAILSLICESTGALGLSWHESKLNEDSQHQSVQVNLLEHHFVENASPAKMSQILNAYASSNLIPPFHCKDTQSFKALRRGETLSYSCMPKEERHYMDHVFSEYSNIMNVKFQDTINVPIPGFDQNERISTINFGLESTVDSECLEQFPVYANLLYTLWNLSKTNPVVDISGKEKEAIKWGIAGKTYEEISMITGFPIRTIRHYYYKVRDQYGFATIQQMLVQVAKDYDISP